ncbi:MAG TPA: hypothetical protein VFF73_03335 [Planctomycetota bacterium]|nr:hypothetical protein [Planctomycetota bacterium]
MLHAKFVVGLVVLAWLFAKCEIEIEGGDGWAGKLPTWKIQNRLTDIIYGGRPLTGYHLYMQTWVLLFAHIPFAIGDDWTVRAEALVLAFVMLFWIVEDFLWFVVNPRFGIRKFKAKEIWWHEKSWWLVAPREYFVMSALATFLYLYGRSIVLP